MHRWNIHVMPIEGGDTFAHLSLGMEMNEISCGDVALAYFTQASSFRVS